MTISSWQRVSSWFSTGDTSDDGPHGGEASVVRRLEGQAVLRHRPGQGGENGVDIELICPRPKEAPGHLIEVKLDSGVVAVQRDAGGELNRVTVRRGR